MTRRELVIFNNSVQQHYESLVLKQEDGDMELAGLGGEELMYLAVELAEIGYDDHCDNMMEAEKEKEWE